MAERGEVPEPESEPEPEPEPGPGRGAGGESGPGAGPRVWSLPALVVLSAAAMALLSATAVLLGALLLTNAPPNSLSQRYQSQLNGLVYPEFEQNWRLFAPDPLQDNINVRVRARSAAGDGGWVDLTAQDIAAIRGNPFPSHAEQNELRRAWDFYDTTHDDREMPTAGVRSSLADEYLKRIALQRLGRTSGGAPITGVELRADTVPVAPPPWTAAPRPAAAGPQSRELPWWSVSDQDYAGL
ncbi:DUF5819 family protein [Kitasatospora sp. RB6PN24]|uniref:DUF5819 family protein n=1 Tax=Kitasatospora humi TaxID=2893891 RepID=UPI001E37E688|nr:DUF5819 family protein [Kitasatospora humi]MCC9307995.1 DUF5819 family protein [Kitasatospora humi]